MHADGLCRSDYGFVVGLRLEAGNVLGHRSGEQLDILRQISDMPAERVRQPLVKRGAVKTHVSAHRLPDADKQAGERRFSGAAGPDNAKTLTGFELECDVLDDDFRLRRAASR